MEEVKMDDSRALEVVAREPDPKLSENALRVLQKRYLKKDDTGRVIETPKELFARVAWNLAQAERNYGATEAQIEETARRFFHIISSLEFLPNSPTLRAAAVECLLRGRDASQYESRAETDRRSGRGRFGPYAHRSVSQSPRNVAARVKREPNQDTSNARYVCER